MARLDINSKVRMNSGYEIPLLGYGVYQTPADVCEEVTDHAIKSGYRHVDSATVRLCEARLCFHALSPLWNTNQTTERFTRA